MKQWFVLILLAVGWILPVRSQTNHAGRDFYLTMGGTADYLYTYNLALGLSSKHQATVTFTYTATGASQTYIVAANSVKEVKLVEPDLDLISSKQPETIENQSLHITADSPITVVVVDLADHGNDATIVYPSDAQPPANEFYVSAPYADVSSACFSLVALCDSVVAEITLTDTALMYSPAVPFTVALNAGQTFHVEALPQDFIDYAGTHIRVLDAGCCNPLNLFCGTEYLHTFYPPSLENYLCCADNMIEQISPVNQWANALQAVPFAPQQMSLVRVMAAQNNTPVYFDNTLVAQINPGGVFDTLIATPTYIHSPSRIHVSQFMLSADCDSNDLGDPEMLQLASLEQGTRESRFRFHQYAPFSDFTYLLTVIAPSAQTSGIGLDGSPVGGFIPFAGSPQFSYTTVAIPDTGITHYFTAPQKVIAYATKVSPYDTYIQALADLNESPPQPTPDDVDTIVACAAAPVTLEASPGAGAFAWSTGDTTAAITTTAAGLITVTGTTGFKGCTSAVSKDRFYLIRTPADTNLSFSLGNDTTVCLGRTLQLSTPFANTTWSDGTTGPTLTVGAPGMYTAFVGDTCGTMYSDIIRVDFARCDTPACKLVFPNSFSPNGDQRNDFFGPLANGPVTGYELIIVNRWGQQLFSTADIRQGWGGTYHGTAQGVETYYFLCRYRCQGAGEQTIAGDFTLLR